MLKTFGIKVFKTFEKINVKNLKKKKKLNSHFWFKTHVIIVSNPSYQH